METLNFEFQEHEDDEVLEFEIEYYFTKYYPAVNFYSNGDYGHPAEGGELEVVSIIDKATGKDVINTIEYKIYQLIENRIYNYDKHRPVSKLFQLPRVNQDAKRTG